MQGDKKEVSYIVFVGFVILFLLFLFLNPDSGSDSNAVIGSLSLGDNPSIITIVVLFVSLIVVLAIVFFIFKKFKKKSVKKGETKFDESKSSGNKKASKSELGDEDIDELFSGEKKKRESKREFKKVNPVKKVEHSQKKEVLTNLQDLKNKVKGMLTQKLTKEQMIGRLKSEGVNVDQITKTIEEVNIDNLRIYVTQALKKGFTKDQIIRDLSVHGWKKEQISRVI